MLIEVSVQTMIVKEFSLAWEEIRQGTASMLKHHALDVNVHNFGYVKIVSSNLRPL